MLAWLLNKLFGFRVGRSPPPLPLGPITPISVMGLSLLDPESALKQIPSVRYRNGTFNDHSRGIEFGTRDGLVDWFTLRWHDPYLSREEGKTAQPFSGAFEVAGQSVRFATTTTEADVTAALGNPYWREDEPDETLLYYEYDQAELQVELARHGALRVITALTPPLMADPKYRSALGVTMPWPPRTIV